MPAMAGHCEDPRYPALAGHWVVGCSKTKAVDLALDLKTGRKVPLKPMKDPGLSDGLVYTPEHGRIPLTQPDDARPSAFQRNRFAHRVSPPAVAASGIAVVQPLTLDVLATDSRVIRKFGEGNAPQPLGWQPPAISGDTVLWAVDSQTDGADIWWASVSNGQPALLAGGPGDQHHVAAAGDWVAWVEPEAVVILNTATQQRTSHPASTGFAARPTVWQGVACWETRDGPDVDIACSDGHRIQGTGHQRYPSRWGNWLLYREGGTVFLHTFEGS